MSSSKRKSCTRNEASSSTSAPSAPCLEVLEHHYGSETGCDVVFLVGPTRDNCLRIPAHSRVLKGTTPVFSAMFSQNFFEQKEEQSLVIQGEGNEEGERIPIPQQIPVPDVEGKAFDNLMKYLYDVPFALQAVETTIETLKAANKYQCAGLIRKCINHLISLISEDSVLLITANVAMLCGDFQNLENLYRECTGEPGDCITFPQILQRRLSEANPELNIELDCAWLVYNCLDFIDRNALAVLQSEEIEDLDYATLHYILSRDTLYVVETFIFAAIVRWADKECKRRHLPLTTDSKREVLQDLLYVPRYLRMDSSSFIAGPVQSGILTPEEIETITHVIQLGPETFTASSSDSKSPECSPFKKIQNLGLPAASKSLRIHLAYMLRPRKAPADNKNKITEMVPKQGQDGNWKWVARLKKMRCCFVCCEGGSGGESSSSGGTRRSRSRRERDEGSRSSSPPMLTSSGSILVERSSSVMNDDHNNRHSSVSSVYEGEVRQEPYKPGFVERAVVIFACLFD